MKIVPFRDTWLEFATHYKQPVIEVEWGFGYYGVLMTTVDARELAIKPGKQYEKTRL